MKIIERGSQMACGFTKTFAKWTNYGTYS